MARGFGVSILGSIETVLSQWVGPAARTFGYLPLRSGTLFLIVGLHAAVFCGLITTLGHTRGLATPTDLESHQLNSVPPER
jgi:hypothetical protein